jgi:hypothetical protein
MSFSAKWRDDRIVFTVEGLFSDCIQELEKELFATLERGNHRIEVDLREAQAPDVIALVALRQDVHKRGGTLQILLSPRLQNVLTILRLVNTLEASEPGDGGLAGKLAPLTPQPPGPIPGEAEAAIPSPETPPDETDTPT